MSVICLSHVCHMTESYVYGGGSASVMQLTFQDFQSVLNGGGLEAKLHFGFERNQT